MQKNIPTLLKILKNLLAVIGDCVGLILLLLVWEVKYWASIVREGGDLASRGGDWTRGIFSGAD